MRQTAKEYKSTKYVRGNSIYEGANPQKRPHHGKAELQA